MVGHCLKYCNKSLIMKIKNQLLLVLCIILISCDNEMAAENVPEAVKEGLASEFPEVRILEWEAVDQNYVAEFNIDNIPYEVMLSPEGELLKYKYDILESELPEGVQATLQKEYANIPIANTEIMIHEGTKYYQVHFDDDLRDYWLVFSEAGQKLDQPTYMR